MTTQPADNESDVGVWNVTGDLAVDALPITPVSVLFAVLMSVVIAATVIGNVLVIISVFTYRPLRHVQNFYIVSLSVADLAVAVLVMPYNVVYSMAGYWPFGGPFCLAWATCDILTCTASILHLCAIAIDRYRAIHDPVAYAQKRTIRRVLFCVFAVWTVSALISVPPLLGWNDSGLFDATTRQCQLTNDPGFVVYSAAGSFYIPLVVMVFVYVKIYRAVRARLRARASSSLVTIGMTNVALATAVTGKPEVARHRPEVLDDEARERIEPAEREGGDVRRQTGSDGDGDDSRRLRRSVANGLKPEAVGDEARERIEPAELDGGGGGDVAAAAGGVPRRKASDDGGDADSRRVRRSLANGLSPRRFREILAESTRRYGSRNRLADDDDDAVGGGSVRVNASAGTGTGSHLRAFLAEKQRISLSRERRAARTMSVVMGAFVLCWLPFFIMYVAMSFCSACADETDPRVVNLVVWLGYVNSTLNPLIYTVFNVDFRRAFSELLRPDAARP